ncbi:ABC transporter substrate-binding protein [Glaciibacter superstes]|uniref:ABC transporter substrate-binding protein n=1 Tax=Glaciibacter superstes TaxID=501023 RepID=UPI0003B5495E|nr:extracellular solute-binding protein [Glaciibacter superstes]
MKLNAHKTLISIAAIAMLGLAGCASSGVSQPTPTADADPLVAEAKAEGSVTLYSSVEEAATMAFTESFTEKYGIQVDVVRLTSAQLAQRFSAESAAGASAADAILVSRTGFTASAIEEGWLVPLDEADLPDYPGDLDSQFVLPDEGTAVTIIQPAGIAYNTDLVDAADVPKTWSDLFDSWDGKIAIPDPASSASYIAEWLAVAKASGDDKFLESFGDQDLKMYASGVPAAQAVAAGEVVFNVMGLPSHIVELKEAGAPIDFVIPDLTSGAEVVVGISEQAKSPYAARLLVQYALTAEGSGVLADAAGAVSPFDAGNLPLEYVSPDLASVTSQQDSVLTKLGLK